PVELRVAAARGEQFDVGASFHDPPVLHHHDEVGGLDRGQPVGDHQRGASRQCFGERLLDLCFRVGVQVRGGFVQDHYAGPSQQQPGKGEPLAFPAGKAVTTLTHHRVETVGQRRDKVSSPCPTQRLPQLLLTRLRPSQQQVSADGVVEQVPVLGHHAHGGTQGRKRQVPHIDPGQPDRALVHVVEPSQQVRNRRFSRPRGPDQGYQLPRFHTERHTVQHVRSAARLQLRHLLQGGQRNLVRGRIGKPYPVKLHGHRPLRHRSGSRTL